MRVLVVEDDQDIREAMRAGLSSDSAVVDVAADGHEALDLLGLNDYDVAVLDRDVPGPDGDEIARRIGHRGAGPRIIMVTAAGAWRRRRTASAPAPTTTSPSRSS